MMYYLVEAVAKEERLLFSTTRPTAENIFAIQTEVAERIAEELNAVLSGAERLALATVPTESLEAYDAQTRPPTRFARTRVSEPVNDNGTLYGIN